MILIVDGTNLFVRSWTVVPQLDGNGNPIGGVVGFLKTLRYLAKLVNPSKIIVVFDGQGGSQRRRKLYSGYKQGRKPIRLNRTYEYSDEFQEKNKINQNNRLRKYLEDLPVHIIEMDNIEADDVIGFLCSYFDDEIKTIASSDKDFYQLLNKKTIIFRPTKKVFYTNKKIIEEFKISAQNFALAKAIVGDPSDNIKGVRSVGFKNLVKYFPFLEEKKEYSTEEIFQFCEEKINNKDKKYSKFIENKDAIELNYKIMQLRDPIISMQSITKIKSHLTKDLTLRMNAFRLKLIEDGIMDKFNDNFYLTFKLLNWS